MMDEKKILAFIVKILLQIVTWGDRSVSENDVQTAGDAREGMVEFPSYLCQLGRGVVFDVPEVVDYLVDAGE